MTLLASLLLALALPVLPVHATTLGPGPGGTSVVRLDTVTGMLPGQTRAVQISPRVTAPAGTGIDAFLDRSRTPWMLYNAGVAPRFTPGLPESGKVFPVDVGSTLPHTQLVDQNGRLVDLASVAPGKVVLLAFIFTRCPDRDECPLLSAKFSELQRKLDPKHFHLVELTLDPPYDSPAVLRAYARQYGADPKMWTMLTGQGREVSHVLDRFGISSLEVSTAKFLHNDKVFLTAPDGKVADIVQTTQFSTGALAAQAEHLAGLASSPIGRIQLALVASAIALCGGSQFAGVVLLETMLFLLIAVVSFVALSLIARMLRRNA
ncbi:MAG TPA: SCO family protein [Candidatus Baltobacteraceae bacterium]|nr:SCO family protein [Candidatus Baltobacteraceae bacterium]